MDSHEALKSAILDQIRQNNHLNVQRYLSDYDGDLSSGSKRDGFPWKVLTEAIQLEDPRTMICRVCQCQLTVETRVKKQFGLRDSVYKLLKSRSMESPLALESLYILSEYAASRGALLFVSSFLTI